MLRLAFALLAICALALAVVLSVLRAVSPAPAPALQRTAPVTAPLTAHVAFVVVDGLRYDVGTDSKRMPHFAEAMRRHTGGEIWSSRVSMTTSAVLAYGTGQRGSLEQVLRNIDAAPPPFETWLEHARAGGLRLMAVGDPAWMQMYGRHLHESRPDPKGVAIDVDFNPQTFRDARELLAKKPSFITIHFVTPDHQGHAYGIFSDRYRRHIHDFDRQLHELLDTLDDSWTVIVTSDHGAADTGTHGTDVDVQRRSPIYAYGPGIAAGVKLEGRLDQADLSGTLAALFGLALPAHSRGHVLVEWLDLAPAERARLACADAQRAMRYARASGVDVPDAAGEAVCAPATAPPSQHISAARAFVEELDRRLEAEAGPLSARVVPHAVLVLLLAAAAILIVLGQKALRGVPAALLLGAVAVGLVFGVERLPGTLPDAMRVVLFTAGNSLLLLALVLPARVAAWLERHPAVAPCVVPGLLVVTYTSNTQPQSYAVLAAGALFLVGGGALHSAARRPFSGEPRALLGAAELIALLLLLAMLALPGVQKSEIYPRWLLREPMTFVVPAVALALWALAHVSRTGSRAIWFAGAALCVASLAMRSVAPPWLGRGAIVAFGVAALVTATRGQRAPALALGVASFVWVARAWEGLALLATLAVAELVGSALARRRGHAAEAEASREASPAHVLLLTAVTFALLYVQRIAIQGALDFSALDWGAAGFGDPHVSAWVVGGALTYKYVLAELLVLGVVGSCLAPVTRQRFFGALVAAHVARAVVLLAMLLVCGQSFWTTLRVVGDLPFALTGAFAATLAWAVARHLMYEIRTHRVLAAPSAV